MRLGDKTMNEHNRKPIDWSKYVMTFIITSLLFGLALWVNNILDKSRTGDLRSLQDTISLNILSSETQYDLLRETSCKNVNDSILSTELNSLEQKLSYLESSQSNEEFNHIKKYYELLQIKDFSLMQRLSEKCGLKPISILYFYGSKTECADCEKTSAVLNHLRNTYPNVRIYSFDRRLSVSAVDTLAKIYKVAEPYPVLVINEETYKGFLSIDKMKEILPELKELDKERIENSSSTTSTSTNR